MQNVGRDDPSDRNKLLRKYYLLGMKKSTRVGIGLHTKRKTISRHKTIAMYCKTVAEEMSNIPRCLLYDLPREEALAWQRAFP